MENSHAFKSQSYTAAQWLVFWNRLSFGRMSTPITVRRVTLGPKHLPSGITQHYREGRQLGSATSLEISIGDPGFYLNYLDENGEVMTDTWHQTLDDAFHQAECEYGVQIGEWTAVA